MKTRACVLHAQEDVRIETLEVGEVGPQQVLVRIGAGGICGSDIHYYWEGGIGTIRVSEPIIMGHEVAGTVEAVGSQVTRVRPDCGLPHGVVCRRWVLGGDEISD